MPYFFTWFRGTPSDPPYDPTNDPPRPTPNSGGSWHPNSSGLTPMSQEWVGDERWVRLNEWAEERFTKAGLRAVRLISVREDTTRQEILSLVLVRGRFRLVDCLSVWACTLAIGGSAISVSRPEKCRRHSYHSVSNIRRCANKTTNAYKCRKSLLTSDVHYVGLW